eukprot:CAMPEP_0113473972 /NCGR_PEP_ID=MMETSP0014_2-20120614/18331_1 /TAXON_ID=2857 /ORGANISM="Nitzschia sp." /LENGTH=573 /DNA_ID=CAMNT_0000366779 /DNA_START=112 /DNA_END=1834 /DNA_ORIENTATION=+ /assembly_acc=CAM_ASM_000159
MTMMKPFVSAFETSFLRRHSHRRYYHDGIRYFCPLRNPSSNICMSTATTEPSSSSSSSSSSLPTTQKQKQKPPPQQQQQKLPVVLLKRNRQSKSFRDGSQLVFSGSIDRSMPKTLKMGDVVQVFVPDSNGKGKGKGDKGKDHKSGKDGNNNKPAQTSTSTSTTLIGWGVYNPESMYRVRLLCHSIFGDDINSDDVNDDGGDDTSSSSSSSDTSERVLRKILMTNFERAMNTRRALDLLPTSSPIITTDTYRLVNGEGDSLSGLAVDVIGDEVAVVMSSAAWCEIHKQIIVECLEELLPDHYDIIWKTTSSRLQQDGYVKLKEQVDEHQARENDEQNNSPDSSMHDRLVIGTENGIKYKTWPFKGGQKTSVYCDQRINRWNLAQHCSGKRVLDLCCYHGGFSLNAAKNGATKVIGVDSSHDAIDTCKDNGELNDMSNTVDFVKSDISDYMKTCLEKFDVVVLDPPKLAPSVSGLQRATRKYHSLNRDALKLIDDSGGLFMTCTCSAAMTQKDGGQYFLQMVHQAALAAKRQVTLVSVHGAAPCHTQSPISYPAGNYLTAALFMVHPKGAKYMQN